MRRIDQLIEGGAYRDDAGAWRVTPAALRAAGFQPGKPSAPDAPNSTASRSYDSAETDAQLAALRAEVAEWRRRAEVAEVRAEERERIIVTQASSLRMLEARPAPRRRSMGEWLADVFGPRKNPQAFAPGGSRQVVATVVTPIPAAAAAAP